MVAEVSETELAGTWPGDTDDGFEEMIDELRHPKCPACAEKDRRIAELEEDLEFERGEAAWWMAAYTMQSGG